LIKRWCGNCIEDLRRACGDTVTYQKNETVMVEVAHEALSAPGPDYKLDSTRGSNPDREEIYRLPYAGSKVKKVWRIMTGAPWRGRWNGKKHSAINTC